MCTHPIFQNLKKTHSKMVEKNVTTFSLKILLYWSKIYLAVFWWHGGKEGVTKSFHLWLTCLTLMHLHPAAPSCSCVHLHRYLWSISCRHNAYFPTTIKVSSKQAALTEVHGRFFFFHQLEQEMGWAHWDSLLQENPHLLIMAQQE